MAFDLSGMPTTGIRVQACGDCHLMNFGAFATPERRVIFDINDFDETLPAPWEWDIKRLAASIMVAGRYRGFAERQCSEAVLMAVRAYRENLAEYATWPELQVWYARIDAEQMVAKASKAKPSGFRRAELTPAQPPTCRRACCRSSPRSSTAGGASRTSLHSSITLGHERGILSPGPGSAPAVSAQPARGAASPGGPL